MLKMCDNNFIPYDCWSIIISYIRNYNMMINVMLLSKGIYKYLIKCIEKINNIEINMKCVNKKTSYYTNKGVKVRREIKINKAIKTLSIDGLFICKKSNEIKSFMSLGTTYIINEFRTISINKNIRCIKIYNKFTYGNGKKIDFKIPIIKDYNKTVLVDGINFTLKEKINVNHLIRSNVLIINISDLCLYLYVINYKRIKQDLNIKIRY